MVKATALIHSLQRKLDRLNSEKMRDIGMVDMCSALTEAQYFLLKDRVQKIEMDKRYGHELRELEVREKSLTVKKKGEISIATLPSDYYRSLNIVVLAEKKDCGKKEIPLTIMRSKEYPSGMNSSYWASSYAWEQVFGDYSDRGLDIFNGKDFSVSKVKMDYIRKPKEIHCPSLVKGDFSYIDWNGKTQTTDSGWELDQLVGEGINLAALMLTRDIGDSNDFRLQLENNIRVEETKMM